MAHGQVTVPVAGELRSVATDGRTVAADGVYDYNLQKTQEQINQELYNGAGGGSSTPVDAYTKAQSDSKYATKTELNSVANNTSHATINKTWAEMIALKNSNGFIPGQTYRITDYLTTGNAVPGADIYGFAGHAFDVIVTALTTNTLDEDARAAKHEGDGYFDKSNLEAWTLKYILDPANDYRFNASYFSGVRSSQTKGWIYYMEDDHFNSANYDFKNILTKGTKVASFKYKNWTHMSDVGSSEARTEIPIKYIFSNMETDTTWDEALQGYYTVDPNDTKLFYTFSYLKEGGTVVDASVEGIYETQDHAGNAVNKWKYPQCNKLSVAHEGSRLNDASSALNPCINLFLCDWEYVANVGVGLPAHNTFGQRCFGNTFGNECHDNLIGSWSNCNVFGNAFLANTINVQIVGSVFGNKARYNDCTGHIMYLFAGNAFQHNTITQIESKSFVGNQFYNNRVRDIGNCTFGNHCIQNELPSFVSDSTFGDNFSHNEGSGYIIQCTIGTGFQRNQLAGYLAQSTIGDGCEHNYFGVTGRLTMGNDCVQNHFASKCQDIVMGDKCINNIFDGSTYDIKMGNNCQNNHFEKQVRYINFGASENELKGYYRGIYVKGYNDHLNINCTGTLSANSQFYGIVIDTRFYSPYYSGGSQTYKTLNNADVNQQYSTTYTSASSRTITE